MAIAAAVAVVGGVMQSNAARRARRYNEKQQAAGLAFQAEQMEKGKAHLRKGNENAFHTIKANEKKAQGDLVANLAGKGVAEGSTMALAAERAISMDTSRVVSENERTLADSLAAIEVGAEFGHVFQDAPTGNWAGDLMGSYLGSQRYGDKTGPKPASTQSDIDAMFAAED
jgi:type II secretory pathway pseudopilin PulG